MYLEAVGKRRVISLALKFAGLVVNSRVFVLRNCQLTVAHGNFLFFKLILAEKWIARPYLQVLRTLNFLHTEEGLYTRNVCVSFKPFLRLFDNYFYINPIRKQKC